MLVPVGIVFVGYFVTYYGATLLRGPGMGALDLLLPNRWGDADEQWKKKYVSDPGHEPGQTLTKVN